MGKPVRFVLERFRSREVSGRGHSFCMSSSLNVPRIMVGCIFYRASLQTATASSFITFSAAPPTLATATARAMV